MNKLIATVLLLLAVPGIAVANHSDRLLDAAYRMDASTERFYDHIHGPRVQRLAAHDARYLLRATRRFIRRMERGEPPNRLQRDYRRIVTAYYVLARRYDHHYRSHGRRHFYNDFGRVSTAFDRLQQRAERRFRNHTGHRRPYRYSDGARIERHRQRRSRH